MKINSLTFNAGVTYEIVSQVPDIHSESEWLTQINTNNIEDDGETLKETFLENYTNAVMTVENLLSLEKQKQSEILTELVMRQSELQDQLMNPHMKKSSSVMNIRSFGGSSLGLNNFGRNKHLSTSQCSLDVTSKKQQRLSLSSIDPGHSNLRTDHIRKLSSPVKKLGNGNNFPAVTITEED